MPPQEVLILAMTQMLSGICTAGFTREPDPVTGLRWVRPVREFGTLLPGDMTDADGRLVQCGDVVEPNLLDRAPEDVLIHHTRSAWCRRSRCGRAFRWTVIPASTKRGRASCCQAAPTTPGPPASAVSP